MIASITGGLIAANGVAMCVGAIVSRYRQRVQCRILYRRPRSLEPAGKLVHSERNLSNAIVEWEPDQLMAYRASYWAWALVAVGGVFRLPLLVFGGGLLTAFWFIPGFESPLRRMISRRRPTVGGLMGLGTGVLLVCQMNIYAASAFNFFQVGRRLSRLAAAQSRRLLAEIFAGEKASAWVCCEGVELSVPFRQLGAEDLIVVKEGAFVPVDGFVVEGHARVNQHLLSPEREGVEKTVGKTVLASSYVESGELVIRAVLLNSNR